SFPIIPPPPHSTLFPYTTLFRSSSHALLRRERHQRGRTGPRPARLRCRLQALRQGDQGRSDQRGRVLRESRGGPRSAESRTGGEDRKSTRLNSSHDQISYAVFCL